MYSNRGTSKPTSQQLESGTGEKSSVKQHFGQTKGKLAVEMLTDLQDDTDYVLFYLYSGLKEVAQVRFHTAESYSPASFVLVFADAEKAPSPSAAAEAVSQTLAISLNCLKFKGEKRGNSNSRRLLSEITYEYLLTTDRAQEIGSPLSQIALLDQRMATLQAFLPGLDPAVSVSATASEVRSASPQFIVGPRVLSASLTSAAIAIVQDQAGKIYAVLLNRSASRPSNEQIVNGLDGANQIVPANRYQVSYCLNASQSVLEFKDLEPYRRYRAWLAGENDLPGFPLRTTDDNVVYLNLTAGKKRSDREEVTIFRTMGDRAGWLVLGLYVVFF